VPPALFLVVIEGRHSRRRTHAPLAFSDNQTGLPFGNELGFHAYVFFIHIDHETHYLRNVRYLSLENHRQRERLRRAPSSSSLTALHLLTIRFLILRLSRSTSTSVSRLEMERPATSPNVELSSPVTVPRSQLLVPKT
jgi:hypothetical protein